MQKTESVFVCKSCGLDHPRWQGQCAGCGEWNALIEEKSQKPNPESRIKPKSQNTNSKPTLISDIDYKNEERIKTGIDEFDRVLGGGVVAGAAILVGGDPGIGKSTLLLQAASSSNKKILYVSGEESAKQVRLRAERLKALSPKIKFLPETDLFAIEKAIEEEKPEMVIVDSIQTIFREDIASSAGSVSQVRESSAYLVNIAKSTHIPIFIIGHVTKDGNIAGPRLLEHIVDVVLYFEGDEHKQFRILRGVKNRFGAISEIGIFEMKENGLVPVENPSELFLSERPVDQSGSSVAAVMEGSRPLLLEVQALTAFTKMTAPRRTVVGADYNRAMIVLAVLEKRAAIKTASLDVFINIAGGIRAGEPAIDLPMALSIASSYKNRPIAGDVACAGEIGLAGEVRAVSHIEQRVREAEKLGFKRFILPAGNHKQLKSTKIKLVQAVTLSDAISAALS